jgi:hypothetical protein
VRVIVAPGAPRDAMPGVCFFSKSSSSSSVQNTTEQTDKRIAATDSAVVVQLSDGSSLELTDPELIAATENIIGSHEAVLKEAFGFAAGESERAAGLTREVLNRARSEQAQFFSELLKWGTALTVGTVLAINAPRFVK